jgi:hypothetical protein
MKVVDCVSLLVLGTLSLSLTFVSADQTCDASENGMCTSSDAITKSDEVLLSFELPAANAVVLPKYANKDGKPREAVKDCIDRHPECVGFEQQGECTKNPGWMIINCPRSCDGHNNACALRDPTLRCSRTSLNISTEPVYKPGDMNNMFNSLQSRYIHELLACTCIPH